MPSSRKFLPIFILLAAFALRAWQLTAIPPGLTHDEAGHGHDAAAILKGVTPIYFTVGYGREPLFDYTNAILIAGIGANPLALRFAAVAWGMFALAATYRAARMIFDRRTAIFALALMAVSFWPLATSRQALRSAMLPTEIALAVVIFLQLFTAESAERKRWGLTIALGIVLAASLYTYIPARALWLMFPLAALAQITRRPFGSRLTLHVLLSVLIAFTLASPLFLYLYQHSEAEQRIGMLSEPLNALKNGDPSAILANARETLLALFLPGHGDHFLAYNIPGKPIFDPLTALLFLTGIIFLLIPAPLLPRSLAPLLPRPPAPSPLRSRTPLLLLWLTLSLAPSLITGPEAMTTRIIGAQPVLYILPAIALSRIASLAPPLARREQNRTTAQGIGVGIWILGFGILSAFTLHDYFFIWGQSPDVRAAYQSTLIAALQTIDRPTVISTVSPSAAHDPYIAELITGIETRWADARFAMIIPADANFQLIAPSSTPLHPSFADLVRPMRTVQMRPDDLDPAFTTYEFVGSGQGMPWQIQCSFKAARYVMLRGEAPKHLCASAEIPRGSPQRAARQRRGVAARNDTSGIRQMTLNCQQINFNNAVELIDYHWSADAYRPGDVAELTTVWRVLDSNRLGKLHPPAFKTDLNLFTHVLNADGSIFLQRDSLDAPSWDWQDGDTIIQIHQLAIPADAAPGEYAAEVGLYDRVTGERLAVIDSGATSAFVALFIIQK